MRAKNPRTLGDLVSGDRAVISIHDQGGDKEVEISFRAGDMVFVRVQDSDIGQPICFVETTPFSKLTYEQPGAMGRNVLQDREDEDPLLRRIK